MKLQSALAVLLFSGSGIDAFSTHHAASSSATTATSLATLSMTTATSSAEAETEAAAPSLEQRREEEKRKLLGMIGSSRRSSSKGSQDADEEATIPYDPVLADPTTKEPLRIVRSGGTFGGSGVLFGDDYSSSSSSANTSKGVKVTLRSSADAETTYSGRTDSYYNLLEASEDEGDSDANDGESSSSINSRIVTAVTPLIPPPLRFALKATGLAEDDYVPMRDLFTNPSVSFAYERGWRQGFAAAGFPGPDKEAEMVMDYFAPVAEGKETSTVVDMSCATGLFTRRLAKSNKYGRVLGCDYSDSMLQEARRRINADPELRERKVGQTRLDLVRLDVGNIPMREGSVDALHAGAAMHCWPDLDSALSEVYRVLKPGGRYFATTFLAQYFRGLQASENGQTGPDIQAFQYFASTEELKDMLVKAGFDEDKVSVEVLGTACVVIKAEK